MKSGALYRKGRVTVQIAVAVAVAVSVIAGMPCLLSRMQIVPAIAACSLVWLVLWAGVTLVLGRVYCSSVCPAGTLMDLSSRLLRRRGRRYVYSRDCGRVRVAVMVSVIACAVMGISAAVALTDPYSSYTRIVVAVAKPLSIGIGGFVAASLTLFVIAFFSARRGRLLCNTICPVGTLLGSVSRYSLYHPDINTDLCTDCGRCSDVCKAECINLTDHVVDLSRCVVCFDCIDTCRDGAITYRRGRHKLAMPMMRRVVGNAGVSAVTGHEPEASADTFDRRRFIGAAFVAAGAWTVGANEADNAGRRYVRSGVELRPVNHVTPPGTSSREDYLRRCTACGACVSSCPSGVLTMSVGQFGVRHALVPLMKFDHAYCRPDCVRCTEMCPTKALTALTDDEKRKVVIGRARVVASNCMLYANSTPCSVCVRRCPYGAV